MHGKKVLVVTNTTIAPLYLDKTISALTDGNPNVTVESVILPDGEQFKDMVSISSFLWHKATNFQGVLMEISGKFSFYFFRIL